MTFAFKLAWISTTGHKNIAVKYWGGGRTREQMHELHRTFKWVREERKGKKQEKKDRE